MWNIRGVGLPWENPYLWPGLEHTWDTLRLANGSWHSVTSRNRRNGVAIRFGYVLLNFFLLVCLYEFGNTEYLFGVDPSDHTPEKESIIRRLVQTFIGSESVTPVTWREFGVRFVFSFENAADNFLLFSLYADVCAIFFVGVGLDESWEWPPFFGQITEAYTMRRW